MLVKTLDTLEGLRMYQGSKRSHETARIHSLTGPSTDGGCGGVGEGQGRDNVDNCSMNMRASISKRTPFIYLAFEKKNAPSHRQFKII